jgi:hypothetical protein
VNNDPSISAISDSLTGIMLITRLFVAHPSCVTLVCEFIVQVDIKSRQMEDRSSGPSFYPIFRTQPDFITSGHRLIILAVFKEWKSPKFQNAQLREWFVGDASMRLDTGRGRAGGVVYNKRLGETAKFHE